MSTSVCVSVVVSVREDIPGTTRAIFAIFVHVAYGRGSVLLRRRCYTLCTPGFVDDITFIFYSGPYRIYGMNFAAKDGFCLNLVIYRNVGHNLITILNGIILTISKLFEN